MSSERFEILSDEPIDNKEEDLFNRTALLGSLYELVKNSPRNATTSIALTGPWGSGKTSVLNLLRSDLSEYGLNVIDFNPWIYSSVDRTVQEFFTLFASYFGKQKKFKRTKKLFLRYAARISEVPLNALFPTLGDFSAEALKMAEEELEKNKPVTELYEDVKIAFQSLDERIVVFIDDLDRNQNAEIMQMLKMIKLLGGFPNVIYLAAFDESSIDEAIKTTGTYSRNYLDKIFNIKVALPEASHTAKTDYFFNLYNKILSNANVSYFDQTRWQRFYADYLRLRLQTARDIKRFCNDLIVPMSLVNTVDALDITILQSLKTFEPPLFELLVMKRQDLCLEWYSPQVHRTEAIKAIWEGYRDPSAAELIISLLFPIAYGHTTNTSYDQSTVTKWKRQFRVLLLSKFSAFLELQSDTEHLRHKEILSILKSPAHEFNEKIANFSSQESISKFRVIVEYRLWDDFDGTLQEVENLIQWLSSLVETEDDWISKDIGITADYLVMRVVTGLIEENKLSRSALEILAMILRLANSTYLKMIILLHFTDSHHFVGDGEKPQVAGFRTELLEEIRGQVPNFLNIGTAELRLLLFLAEAENGSWNYLDQNPSADQINQCLIKIAEGNIQRREYPLRYRLNFEEVKAVFGTVARALEILDGLSDLSPELLQLKSDLQNANPIDS